jgi:hypothetical protein
MLVEDAAQAMSGERNDGTCMHVSLEVNIARHVGNRAMT